MWNPLKNINNLIDKSLDDLEFATEIIDKELQRPKKKSLKYKEFKDRFNNYK